MDKIEKQVSARGLKIEASRGKYKIGVDENIANLGLSLKGLGYVIWTPVKGLSYREVDKLLRQMNCKYFITNNYDDFAQIIDRTYFVLGVPKSYEDIGLSRIVEKYFLRFRTTMIPGQSFKITQMFINRNLK